MKSFDEFKKEWPKIKKQLLQVSEQAVDLVKKGEKEVVQLSKRGKLQVDLTSLGLKKEHLYYQIGKELVKTKHLGSHTATLTDLIEDLKDVEKQEKALRKRIKTESGKKD